MNENHEHLVPLIDCDLIRYRCGFAADGQLIAEAGRYDSSLGKEEVQELLASTDYMNIALQNTKTVMESLIDRFKGKHQAFIDGKGNFRDTLATLKPYKGNRTKAKPKYYTEIGEYLVDRWGAQVVEGQESDDAIGIAQSTAPVRTTVICSNDKDMDQIAGYHFNWVTGNFYEVPPDAADLMLFWQMLVGDSTDNIPGIDKIGPVKATKLLYPCTSVIEARSVVESLYQKQYGERYRSVMKEVGNLLWIRRAPNEECPWV